MKLIRPIDGLTVKKCFVISNRMKSNKIIPKERYITKLSRVKEEVLALSEKDLDTIIGTYKKRLNLYNKVRWYVAEFPVEKIGVWKKAAGLPLKWTTGNLVDTSSFVFKSLEKNPKKRRWTTSINGILSVMQEIKNEDYLRPIVFPNGATMGRKGMNKFGYELDDGNMRAIAMTGQDSKILHVFLGLRLQDILWLKMRNLFGLKY